MILEESTRAVLCLLAGYAAGSPAADPTKVEIEVIEDALMSFEPVGGMRRVPGRGPGRRLMDDSMPRPVRTGGSADGVAIYGGPARESPWLSVRHPKPVLRLLRGPFHGPIDPPSDTSRRIAERIPASP
jgi:hypothetical protein